MPKIARKLVAAVTVASLQGRYWWHPESDCFFLSREDEAAKNLEVQELTKEQYEYGVEQQKKKKDEVFYDLLRDGITYSSLETWITCPEKFRLGVVEGLSALKSSVALDFGSQFHNAHDVLYSMARDGTLDVSQIEETVEMILDEMYEKMEAELLAKLPRPEDLEEWKQTFESMAVTFRAYVRYYISDFTDKGLQWESLEELFKIPYTIQLPGEESVTIYVRGKRDGTFSVKDKMSKRRRVYLFETKTKAIIDDGATFDKLSFELQCNLYLSTLRQKLGGETPGGVLYNLVRRSQLRLKKTETRQEYVERIAEDIAARPEHYFQRINVAITEKDLNEWEPTFLSMLTQIYRWSRGEFHYRNSAACNGRFGVCHFLTVCASGDKSYLKKRNFPFPELDGD